MINTTFY